MTKSIVIKNAKPDEPARDTSAVPVQHIPGSVPHRGRGEAQQCECRDVVWVGHGAFCRACGETTA